MSKALEKHLSSAVMEMKLGQRFKVPGGEIEVMRITPSFAKDLLGDKYAFQRPVRQKLVDRYANDMSSGLWRQTLIPLLFNTDLEIFDGQHRLLAQIKAGVTLTWLVAVVEDPKAFYAVDQGGGRTLNDVRVTLGETRLPKSIAGAILLESQSEFERHKIPVSAEARDKLINEFEFMEEIYTLHKLGHNHKICVVSVLASAIRCMRSNKAAAMEFFSSVVQLNSVIAGKEVKSARLLYSWLVASDKTGEVFKTESIYKCIRAYNIWRSGEDVKKLQYAGGKFPKPRR